MKIEGYEEISGKEYDKLPDNVGAYFEDLKTDKTHYFKKAQKFPIVFEDDERIITVDDKGLRCKDKFSPDDIVFGHKKSFPLLVKAVEKAKEVMKKNETD